MTDRELLERHKPVLKFDPQYDFGALAAGSALGNAGNLLRREHGEVVARSTEAAPLTLDALTAYEPEPGDYLSLSADYPGDSCRMEAEELHRGCIYGRVTRDGEMTWLQYWFWIYYNPKNLFGFGKHEGDWEMVQIGLDEELRPKVASYAQHNSGEARPWRSGAMELVEDDPDRPVVYVAPLSHASYFEAGTHPYLLGMDDPRGDGPAVDLPLVEFGEWVSWPGRWGNPERAFLGRVGQGPQSPANQGAKWDAPAAWHRSLRNRKARVLLGRGVHRVGFLSYPHPPAELAARADGERVVVSWRLARSRPGRHLYVTLHEDHLVLCSRVVPNAAAEGETSLRVPEERRPTAVMASAYNRLRQRSEPVRVPLEG